jgi:hypothetical protein
MFAVMKTFVTDISASTGRNYFIFDMWLWHGDLYSVSFPGLLHIYFLFTVWLRIFHIFTAFSGDECWDIYKFDTNERVGVFLVWRSMQHLVNFLSWSESKARMSFSHHLASCVCNSSSVNFSHFDLLLKNHWI